MSKKPAAIPLFADAYLADTTHLTTEEHGAYLLLLMASWRQEDCALPNDDRKLARIAGLSPRKWKAIKGTILEFWAIEEGRIFQSRLRQERAWVDQKSNSNRKSARARWDSQAIENKHSGGVRSQCEGNAPPPPPIPLSKDNGEIVDPGKQLWASAIAYLGERRRPLIGKWCSAYGQPETAKAITDAQCARAAEPVAYIEKILRSQSTGPFEFEGGPC